MAHHNYLTAIDIGSSQIAIVDCELFEGQEPQITHLMMSPSQGVDRGYISNIAHTTESLKQALEKFEKKTKRKINRAAFSIGTVGLCSQYVKTNIELKHKGGEITKRDTQEVVNKAELLFSDKYPNKKILHIVPVSYRVDDKAVLGSPVGMFGDNIEAKIIIVTVPEHHFEALVNVAESVGIVIEEIVPAPLADAAVCLSYNQKKQGSVLVNIGSETTQISTFEQGILTSMKVVSIGSGDITNDLALGLKISINQAQDVKHGKNRDFSEKRVREIQSARLIDIIESVEKHLRAIKKNRLLPAGVIWSGDGSQITGINEYAKSILHIPSSQTSLEQQTIRGKRKIKIKPKYSTAYGLCKIDENENTRSENFSFKGFGKKLNYWIEQLKP